MDFVVMLIRHAEKPDGSADPRGVDEYGTQDSESLTTRGWARAGALTALFAPFVGQVRDGLAVPRALFASKPGKRGSKRPAQTISHLANRLDVQIDASHRKDDAAGVVAAAKRAGSALISWPHEDILAIVAEFGSVAPAPPDSWPDDRFDVVWVLRSTDGSSWRFSQVPQQLLAGDDAGPIH